MLAQPDVRERIANEGADPVGSTPEQLSAVMRVELPKWAKVARAANIKVD